MVNEGKKIGNNDAVILDLLVLELTLQKKHHSINYNYAREVVASGMALIYKMDNESNISDLFKKLLIKFKRKEIIQCILYNW